MRTSKFRNLLLTLLSTMLFLNFSGCLNHKDYQPESRQPKKQSDQSKKQSKNQSKQSRQAAFLSKSYGSLGTEKRVNASSFKLLDSALKGKEVFFMGEIHGIEGNELLDFELLKYLNKKIGIKYYLSEMGPANAFYFNRYLTTGNEAYLKQMYKTSVGTIGWTQETYEGWKNLYRYNQTLPPQKRITLVGIDIQHQPDVGIWFLRDLLPKSKPPQPLTEEIAHLIRLYDNKTTDLTQIKTLTKQLQSNWQDNKALYQNYLGKNYFDFTMGLTNLTHVFDFMSQSSDYVKGAQLRDNAVYDNFLRYYNHLPKGKYYGLWGRPHTYQREQYDVNYIATLMNQENSPVKNKVLSIAIFYQNCSRIAVEQSGSYGKEPYYDEPSTVKPLDQVTDNKVTLFRLIGKDSPFAKGLYIVDLPTGGGTTTDYFQYAILIKNAGPSKPLGKKP